MAAGVQRAVETQTINSQFTSLQQEMAKMKKEFSAELGELKKEIAELRKSKNKESSELGWCHDTPSSDSYWDGEDDMVVIYNSKDISSLDRRVDRLEQEFKANIVGLGTQVAGYVETVQALQENATRHSVTMEEIKLRQDILDVKTTHGIFIWRIPEVARHFRDARRQQTISLYSPPFLSSPHGYRMCIRAYLNGKEAHISLFFVLMKSEYDNILKWPFDRSISFELINQKDRSCNISRTFMPDKHNAAFQQPKSEMNIASGFPCFAPHRVLEGREGFVKGDTLFVRCKIDNSSSD